MGFCFELDIHIYHIYLFVDGIALMKSCFLFRTFDQPTFIIKGTILVLFILVLFIVHNAPPWYHLKLMASTLYKVWDFGLSPTQEKKVVHVKHG